MPNAVKSIAKYVHKHQGEEGAIVLRELCEALENDKPFVLARLYDIPPQAFELAMNLIVNWRLDRYLTKRRFAKYFAELSD